MRHYDRKSLFRAIILSVFLCFLALSVVHKTKTAYSLLPSSQEVQKHAKLVIHGDPLNTDMNKRRTPNGPDPIHNRRAGNSGRPPGQS
nr:CLAVATA3/ESR (CLE)-related protein 25 [Tanacetum cinerariifolium]